MKTIIFLFSFLSLAYAGTCTSISRTNNSPNTVLTSTKYNTDLNTVYSAANDFDGGCITDGTLESSALNATDFAFLNKGIHQGCKASRSNDSTVSVDKCYLSVGGNFVATTAATTQSFGCTGCSSETSSTTYYVYAKPDSDGTTLNLLLLTTAPDADGFDSNGNKVLARFFNNASSNIQTNSFYQWTVNEFLVPNAITNPSVPKIVMYSFIVAGGGTVTEPSGQDFVNGNCTNAAPSVCTLNTTDMTTLLGCVCSPSTASGNMCSFTARSITSLSHAVRTDAGSDNNPTVTRDILCWGTSQ